MRLSPRSHRAAALFAIVAAACDGKGGPAPVDAAVTPGEDAANPAADAGTDRDADPGHRLCVGVRPEASAWLAEPGPRRGPEPDGGTAAADAGTGCAPAACVGAMAPEWALRDFQPQSCGSGATYGLDVFRGKVTVVALLAAW